MGETPLGKGPTARRNLYNLARGADQRTYAVRATQAGSRRRKKRLENTSFHQRNGPVTTTVVGLDQLPRFGTHQQRLYVLQRDGYACRYCGCPVTIDTANLDHVLPYKLGGETLVANLVACCRECNKHKGNNLWKLPKARKTE